jgi:hypothetical protein
LFQAPVAAGIGDINGDINGDNALIMQASIGGV